MPIYTKHEPSIQKHSRFWDKTNKGYITPLDTISGFITLGYGMIFSVAMGAFVSVFLSLSTQTGWLPDPLCRSKIKNLITIHTQPYDENGVFQSNKFENVFNKYAKSHTKITLTEFIQMTKDQEKLGKNVKAWTLNIAELCSIYFLIGNRGYLSKEDVLAAYDGSLFYRLADKNKLMVQDKEQRGLLKGAYLSKPSRILNVKALEHKVQVLLSTLQSNSSLASEYGINEWISYIQETADTMKQHALRRPARIINGIAAPKPQRKVHTHKDPSTLFPEGLTGVVKETNRPDLVTEDYLGSLLSDDNEPHIFRNLTKDDSLLLTSTGIIAVNATTIRKSNSSKENSMLQLV